MSAFTTIDEHIFRTLRADHPVIKLQGVGRSFKDTQAIVQLNLGVKRGEIYGLVGPDGAGKTTALRLIAGLLRLSAGSGSVLGYDLQEDAERIKPHLGYMAQRFSLYGDLSVWENLEFFADLHQLLPSQRSTRMAHLLRFARLTEFGDRRAAQLSGGMQKKLALACTLIHQPQILLLDEPTTGVDPLSRREFWDILTELHGQGTTIVVSTPYMDEAERCQRVGLLYAGRMVVSDAPAKIRGLIQGELLEFQTADWRQARAILSQAAGVLEVQVYGQSLRVFVDSASRRLPRLVAALQEQGLELQDIRRAPARLEEAFISMIRTMRD